MPYDTLQTLRTTVCVILMYEHRLTFTVAEFHDTIVQQGGVQFMIRLSLSPLTIFHLDIVKSFNFLSQNPNHRSFLLREGVVPRLWVISKDTQNEKVRKHCVNALRKL